MLLVNHKIDTKYPLDFTSQNSPNGHLIEFSMTQNPKKQSNEKFTKKLKTIVINTRIVTFANFTMATQNAIGQMMFIITKQFGIHIENQRPLHISQINTSLTILWLSPFENWGGKRARQLSHNYTPLMNWILLASDYCTLCCEQVRRTEIGKYN